MTTSFPALPFFTSQGLEQIGEREEITRGGDFIRVFDMVARLDGPPHEGRELELMLAGKKKLAYFALDAPEDEFRPYVESGRIKRFAWTELSEHFDRLLKERAEINTSVATPIIFYLADCAPEKDRLVELLTKHQIHGQHNAKDELEMGVLLAIRPLRLKPLWSVCAPCAKIDETDPRHLIQSVLFRHRTGHLVGP